MTCNETPTSEARTRPSRSSIMMDCLRRDFLYCEKRARDFVFDAAEAVVVKSHLRPLLLHRLRRLIAEQARNEATRGGYEFTNWAVGTKTTLNAMLRAGVLHSHGGKTIKPGIAAEATHVTAIRPGFRDRTESYLLEFLIRELGDVSTRDHTALAHALFRQFDAAVAMEDMEDRVAVLLAGLGGTVELLANGTYLYTGQNSSTPAATS